MIYIEKVKFNNDELFKNLKFDCKDINVFVGDNGVGKTTMLKNIKNNDCEITPLDIKNETGYFDTEKDNPGIIDTLPMDSSQYGYILSTNFESHGETILPILNSMLKQKDIILFIDEPESGISLKNQIKICKEIKKAAKHNQLFISTHSYIIIKNVECVFDLETNKWIKSKDYLNNVRI